MMAFFYAVTRLLAFEGHDRDASSRTRQVEAAELVEVLVANACAVVLLAGTMTGLASIFVHVVRFILAEGGGF